MTSPSIDETWKKLVKDKHELLQEVIKNLKHQRELSFATQRDERSIIAQLKEEVQTLKSEKIALEEKIARDERVCSLEKERDYYRKESIRLNSVVENLKSKLGGQK